MEWPSSHNDLGILVVGIAIGIAVPRLGGLLRKSMMMILNQPTKMVLVVRNDLGMGKGKIGSQCAHAAIQCYITGLNTNKKVVEVWLASGQPKVVVKVNSEEELIAIAEASIKRGLINSLIKDAGKTQLAPHTFTVLGIGPAAKTEIDLVTKHLKLM